jgi:hypothetical protein
MKLPPKILERSKRSLNHLVDERTSGLGGYTAAELAMDEQEREDIDRIQTVADVYNWLRFQGQQDEFLVWIDILDPLEQFDDSRISGANEETAFKAYLKSTYGAETD